MASTHKSVARLRVSGSVVCTMDTHRLWRQKKQQRIINSSLLQLIILRSFGSRVGLQIESHCSTLYCRVPVTRLLMCSYNFILGRDRRKIHMVLVIWSFVRAADIGGNIEDDQEEISTKTYKISEHDSPPNHGVMYIMRPRWGHLGCCFAVLKGHVRNWWKRGTNISSLALWPIALQLG